MHRRTSLATPATLHRRRATDNFLRGWVGDRRWLAAAALFAGCFASQADAQEVPRLSYARQVEKKSLPTIANFKVGEVLLRVDASMTTEFVDNVDLTQNGRPDLIFTPQVGIGATWAMTKLNTLQFRAGLGYSYYMNNPNLNRQTTTITPDSALVFNVYAGDVKISFHDRFGLQQETTSLGTLNGLAQVERFTNTAGFTVLWDTNDVIWNFGYDHFNFITLGGANSSSGTAAASYSRLDHSTDQVSASIATKAGARAIVGIEGTMAYSNYPKQSGSNFTSVQAGLFSEVQLTKYTHMFLSGGFKGYYSGANAPGSVTVGTTTAQPAGGDPTGFYANLSLVHRMNRFYSDQLNISRSDDVDALSGHTQANSVRYSGTWQVNRKMTLGMNMFAEDVTVIAGSALSGGGVASDFRRFGASLNTGIQISEHLGLSFGYQYLKKQAVRATEGYTQNRVTFTLGYRF